MDVAGGQLGWVVGGGVGGRPLHRNFEGAFLFWKRAVGQVWWQLHACFLRWWEQAAQAVLQYPTFIYMHHITYVTYVT